MVTPQLLDYIRQQMSNGISKDIIKNNLTQAGGWAGPDVDEAFRALEPKDVPQSPVMPSPAVPLSSMTHFNPVATVTTEAPALGVKYAGFWIRFVATLTDGIIMFAVVFAIELGLALALSGRVDKTVLKIIVGFVGGCTPFVYYIGMLSTSGATLGKKLMGIVVRSENLENLSVGHVILREVVGKFLSLIILGIGFMMAGFTNHKRALHDIVASSVVVYSDPSGKKSGVVIGTIIATFFAIIVIAGIMFSIIVSSLQSARQKFRDAMASSTPESFVATSTSPNVTRSDAVPAGGISYVLPAGWQTDPRSNNEVISTADMQKGYEMAISITPLPASMGAVTSIGQIASQSDVKKQVKAKFPNVTIGSVASSTIAGEGAINLTYTGPMPQSGNPTQTKASYIDQYLVIHNNTLYTIIFASAQADQKSAKVEFDSIVPTFSFK